MLYFLKLIFTGVHIDLFLCHQIVTKFAYNRLITATIANGLPREKQNTPVLKMEFESLSLRSLSLSFPFPLLDKGIQLCSFFCPSPQSVLS